MGESSRIIYKPHFSNFKMGKEITVLLVEDESIIAQDLRMLLQTEGYTVVGIADNGKEAIRLASLHSPRIILMDIQLKGDMDGIQAVDAIGKSKEPNIVYLTSSHDPDTLARAEATNPRKILAKFKRHELLDTLEQL